MVTPGDLFIIPVYLAASRQYSALLFVPSGTGKSGNAEVCTETFRTLSNRGDLFSGGGEATGFELHPS